MAEQTAADLAEIGAQTRVAASAEPLPQLTKGARTRLRILDAAARVLRQRGYADTRLSDIAEVAGLQTGSLAFHFASKSALIDEVLRHGMTDGLASVRAAVAALGPDATPAERVTAAIHAHLDGLDERNDYAPALLRMVDQYPAESRRRFRDVDRAYVGYWRELLGAAQRAGAIPGELDVPLLTRLTLGAMNTCLGRVDTTPRPLVVSTVLHMIGLKLP